MDIWNAVGGNGFMSDPHKRAGLSGSLLGLAQGLLSQQPGESWGAALGRGFGGAGNLKRQYQEDVDVRQQRSRDKQYRELAEEQLLRNDLSEDARIMWSRIARGGDDDLTAMAMAMAQIAGAGRMAGESDDRRQTGAMEQIEAQGDIASRHIGERAEQGRITNEQLLVGNQANAIEMARIQNQYMQEHQLRDFEGQSSLSDQGFTQQRALQGGAIQGQLDVLGAGHDYNIAAMNQQSANSLMNAEVMAGIGFNNESDLLNMRFDNARDMLYEGGALEQDRMRLGSSLGMEADAARINLGAGVSEAFAQQRHGEQLEIGEIERGHQFDMLRQGTKDTDWLRRREQERGAGHAEDMFDKRVDAAAASAETAHGRQVDMADTAHERRRELTELGGHQALEQIQLRANTSAELEMRMQLPDIQRGESLRDFYRNQATDGSLTEGEREAAYRKSLLSDAAVQQQAVQDSQIEANFQQAMSSAQMRATTGAYNRAQSDAYAQQRREDERRWKSSRPYAINKDRANLIHAAHRANSAQAKAALGLGEHDQVPQAMLREMDAFNEMAAREVLMNRVLGSTVYENGGLGVGGPQYGPQAP